MVGLVKQVWFGLVKDDDIKSPLVPLRIAKASLELHLDTFPARVGLGRVSLGRVGPGRVGPGPFGPGRSNSDNKSDSSSAWAGTEICKKRRR